MSKIHKPIKKVLFSIKLKKVHSNYFKLLKIVQKKNKIKVAFLVIHESVWKYDEVYKLMERHQSFEPVIIICPITSYGEDNMIDEMGRAFDSFAQKGYQVIKTLKKDGSWLNVKNEIEPDIVFFTNPWRLTLEAYYINNFMDTLTCYVPYFFHVTKHLSENYGGIVQSFAWKVFYETETHFEYAKIYSKNRASNVIVTGYPGIDPFFKGLVEKDPWKIQEKRTKRIIWAPHHTIGGQEDDLKLSNFTSYANFFLDLIKKYFSEIQIAFKPHPLLKSKLFRDPNWGVEKTNEYYAIWDTLDNGLLVEGEYKDLFLTSDAIIHDSGSFSVEYLATLKPALYTLSDLSQMNSLNEFGKKAIKCHYKAFIASDIENFIVNTVIWGDDPMKTSRTEFVKQYLIPPNRKSASENIIDNILSALNK
ncbi:MAG: CDP-glycerol glycerophosphotransferase family protein [Pseudomonadota bacterium]